MKKIIYLIALCICCNMCCNKHENQSTVEIVEEYEYTLKDYMRKDFKIYKPKENIYHLLDTVINTINNCEAYVNKQIGYTLNIYSASTSISISIRGYDYKDIDFESYYANSLFFYKGYKFLYFGDFFEELFIDTETTEKYNYIQPLDAGNPTTIDDTVYRFAYFEYIYEKANFKQIAFACCHNSFIDTNYIKVEPAS